MLRIEVTEPGGARTLPGIDVDDAVFVIGSGVDARVRLPAAIAQPEHVRIERGRWHALGPVSSTDTARTSGEIGDGVTLAIGSYEVRIAPAPAGTVATPPQRTESLARELMRTLLGSDSAPSLEVERGPVVGARKALPPPESVLVIGRGDEANWILLDEDLSRAHAEVRRGWDGTRVVDLGSKNGTKLDGQVVTGDGAPLRDGALVELGTVALRFRDPAEQHQRAAPVTAVGVQSAPAPSSLPTTGSSSANDVAGPRASSAPFYAALTIMLVALAGLAWILSA